MFFRFYCSGTRPHRWKNPDQSFFLGNEKNGKENTKSNNEGPTVMPVGCVRHCRIHHASIYFRTHGVTSKDQRQTNSGTKPFNFLMLHFISGSHQFKKYYIATYKKKRVQQQQIRCFSNDFLLDLY